MNYKAYYENQIGSGLPVFAGYANQRGHGLGGIFRKLSSFILPLLKTHALPFLKRGGEAIGNEVIKTASNIATDAISGKNLEKSAKENFQEAVNNLSQKAKNVLQSGSGKKIVKRKRSFDSSFKKPKLKYRRLKDIFD